MSEPWYDANNWSWVPGATLGVVGGTWGALVGILGSKGKAKNIIWGSYFLFLLAGAAMTAVGIFAIVEGQPYGIWYGFLLPGVLTLLVVGPMGFIIRRGRRMAEQRKMQAQELE